MNKLQETLKKSGANFTGQGRISHFRDISESYKLFSEGVVLVPMLGTSIYKLTGADRLEFLHGQVSNTVKGLQVGQHNTSLMLNIKGHALAQLQVYVEQDHVLIAVEGGMGDFVKAHLERHIIFDQVEIEDLSESWITFSYIGAYASGNIYDLVSGMTEIGDETFLKFDDIIVAKSKRTNHTSFDILTPIDLTATRLIEHQTLAGEDLLNLARIEAGIAHAEFEGGEGSLPQEVGLEGFVHYKKGCYLGQEIMARIEARGNLRKDIFALELSAVPEDMTLVAEGKTVGKITSVAMHPEKNVIGLAQLRKDYVAPLQVGDEEVVVEARAITTLT